MTQIVFGTLMIVIGLLAFVLLRRLRANELRKAEISNREIDTSTVTTFSWVGAVLAAAGAILLFVSGFVVVEAGHRGVVVLFGNVQEQMTLTEGFHVVNPLVSVRHQRNSISATGPVHKALPCSALRLPCADRL